MKKYSTILLLFFVSFIAQSQTHLFWVDQYGIYKGDENANNIEELASFDTPNRLVVNDAESKIYFSTANNKINKINLDGTELENVYYEVDTRPVHVCLDSESNRMYWSDVEKEEILRANLDGTNVETILDVSDLGVLNDISINVSLGKIFWTDGEVIQRADLDGTNVEDIFFKGSGGSISSISVNEEDSKLYLSQSGSPFSMIRSITFEGEGLEDVWELLGKIVDLEVHGQQFYWTNNIEKRIFKLDLAVSDPALQIVATEEYGSLRGVAYSNEVNKVYWAFPSFRYNRIKSYDFSSLEIEPIFQAGFADLVSIGINPYNLYLYAYDYPINKLHTLGVDGSDFQTEELASFPAALGDVYWNWGEEKIYWLDNATKNVFKSNFDGWQKETVLDEGNIVSLFIDQTNNQLYFMDSVSINRANIDGSNINTIIEKPGGFTPWNTMLIDPVSNQIYWTEYENIIVQDYTLLLKRANMDGLEMEVLDLFGYSDRISEIEIDNENEKLYYMIDSGPFSFSQIYKSNYDYSENELLLNQGFNSISYKTFKVYNGPLDGVGIAGVKTPSFEVYPNPTTDYLIIDEPNLKGKAFIINAIGQFVKEVNLQGNNKIDCTDLSTGLYNLVIKDENGEVWGLQFVKE